VSEIHIIDDRWTRSQEFYLIEACKMIPGNHLQNSLKNAKSNNLDESFRPITTKCGGLRASLNEVD
jgi:hypothetical protein